MKLKTLNDLGVHNCEFCDSVTYRREELKQEAIKWVKAHQEQGHQTIKLMLYFHNLTEEDLK